VDVIVSSGGTGLTQCDVTPEATARLFHNSIPGFGELFRMLSYDEIGSSAIESRANAGIANGTIVFNLPGSPGACRLAMDSIILKQLDARTQ
jgi:molybdenum cofactor biosynthesis protein B